MIQFGVRFDDAFFFAEMFVMEILVSKSQIEGRNDQIRARK